MSHSLCVRVFYLKVMDNFDCTVLCAALIEVVFSVVPDCNVTSLVVCRVSVQSTRVSECGQL